SMGLSPEISKTTVVSPPGRLATFAGTVQNIFVKLEGNSNSKSVLLVSHYDSVPTGPGASDDGAGVASMLESLRALRTEQTLKNDLLFLFTDAEEIGLLGAKAFVDENPLIKNVGVVINLEARGNSGPAIMFETSNENGWLIKESAKSVPGIVANSLSGEIYRRLPNDTDLSVFKRAGLSGLNFAYIKGLNHYHTQLDSVANIDKRSLQHLGNSALALARHFGNANLEQTKETDAVYFSVPGSSLIYYPATWAIPLAITAIAIFVAVTILGFRKKQLSFSGIVLGSLAYLISVVASVGITMMVWKIVIALQSDSKSVAGNTADQNPLYLASVVALCLAITSTIYIGLKKKINPQNLRLGALLWWLILVVFTSLFLAGGSYLFTWPLIFSLVAMGATLSWGVEKSKSLRQFAALSIGAIPGLVLLPPMIYMIFLAMTLRMVGVLAVMIMLLIGLLIPHIELISGAKKWALPVSSLAVGIGMVIAASLIPSVANGSQRVNNVFYAMNGDSGKAVWASFDQKPDEWTSQFFAGEVERGSLADYITTPYNGFTMCQAPLVSLSPPVIQLLDDHTGGAVRSLRMRITSPRHAPVVIIAVESNTEVSTFSVNQRRVTHNPQNRWELRYHALPEEGIDLSIEVKSSEPVKIRVTDLSYGLPEIPNRSFRPRASDLMPSPLPYSDTTLVSKSSTF
ncbi:MAG: M20/M25/M40 family metallo-hydrolase, partial [Nitrososphaerales archaeon]